MTRSRRQLLVIGVGIVTALLASALPLHGFGILVVGVLAGLDILLLQATAWLAFRRGSGLDERQTALRDLAYRRGFRWIGMAVLLLFLFWFLSLVAVTIGSPVSAGAAIDGGIDGGVLVAAAEVLIMMPTCMIAWRKDGDPEPDAFPGDAMRGRHRSWAAWFLLPAIFAVWLLAVTSAPRQAVASGSITAGGGPGSNWTCHEFGGGTMIGAEFGATVGLRAEVCWNGSDAFVWGNPNLPLPASLNISFHDFTARELDAFEPFQTACGLDNASDFAAIGQTVCSERIDSSGTMHYTVSARVSPLPFGIASREVTVDLVVTRTGKVLEGRNFEGS